MVLNILSFKVVVRFVEFIDDLGSKDPNDERPPVGFSTCMRVNRH